MIAILPSCRLALRAVTAPPANPKVVHLHSPIVLKAVRQAIGERAKSVGATEAQRHHAFNAALRELDAGRSAAVALSVGYGTLSGRGNDLLHAPVPA